MKKIIITLIVLALLCGCENINEHETAEYCLLINKKIANYNYDNAELKPGKIILYTIKENRRTLSHEINFEEYDESINILYIEKYKDFTLYATSGWLDDSSGFMITNDASDINLSEAFEGIKKIEKLYGKVYKYSTVS